MRDEAAGRMERCRRGLSVPRLANATPPAPHLDHLSHTATLQMVAAVKNSDDVPSQLAPPGGARWDVVVMDEGHKLKNTTSRTATNARCIPTAWRLLLTGTPVQNNVRELWSLFDWLSHGSLLGGWLTFKTEVRVRGGRH